MLCIYVIFYNVIIFFHIIQIFSYHTGTGDGGPMPRGTATRGWDGGIILSSIKSYFMLSLLCCISISIIKLYKQPMRRRSTCPGHDNTYHITEYNNTLYNTVIHSCTGPRGGGPLALAARHGDDNTRKYNRT